MGRSIRLPDLANEIPVFTWDILKKLFVVYKKFEFNWVSCILFSNPREEVTSHSI